MTNSNHTVLSLHDLVDCLLLEGRESLDLWEVKKCRERSGKNIYLFIYFSWDEGVSVNRQMLLFCFSCILKAHMI